ncbi:MAG: DNA starvation/stationary phase protection protein [Caulobacteraceae bacterium]|nr:DNA starvation/stationary phase protection protein [Caulobacter sp.]
MAKDVDEAQPQYHVDWRVIQEFDTVKTLPLALAENARKRSIGALNQILADTMTLRDLYKKAHWQISGATFYQLHLLLDKHYEEQAAAVDKIAERIMSLGGISYASPWDVAEATTLQRPPKGREDVPSNLSRLLEAHRKCLAYMREAAKEATDYGDDGTNDLIVSDLIRTHEPQVWFLAEHLAATPLLPATSGEAGDQPPRG